MIQTKLTLNSGTDNLGVFLHPPGNMQPVPLPGIAHSVTLALEPGVYAVACSGTGLVPGTKIGLEISTSNTVTRSNKVRPTGQIIAWFTFELLGTGAVK